HEHHQKPRNAPARNLSDHQRLDGTDGFQSWLYHADPCTGSRHFDSHRQVATLASSWSLGRPFKKHGHSSRTPSGVEFTRCHCEMTSPGKSLETTRDRSALWPK